MNAPGSPGDILRAIARSYQEEVGQARAEQLVNRAMARAGGRSPRLQAMGVLVAGTALGVTVLALGLIVLLGNSDAGVSAPEPATPVASAPVAEVQAPDSQAVASPILPTEELQEALTLLEQQREMEAANVVIRALGPIFLSAGVELSPPTSTTVPEQPRTSTSAAGAVPPEQGARPQDPSADDQTGGSSGTSQGESPTQEIVPDSQPTIEELGHVLKVEVEELLSADPTSLTEAAEDARDAAQQITEFGQEPTILLPPDQDDDDQ